MIQVYTGNGKGKTSAALGLALRAAGAGFRVYIGQFAKGRPYSELSALRKIRNIEVEQFGRRCFIRSKPEKKDIELACNGLKEARKKILSRKYRLVVLDEVNIAVKFNLINLADLMKLLQEVPRDIEIILTGRYACNQIIKAADLVSEIKERKHYYKNGIKARRGIEF